MRKPVKTKRKTVAMTPKKIRAAMVNALLLVRRGFQLKRLKDQTLITTVRDKRGRTSVKLEALSDIVQTALTNAGFPPPKLTVGKPPRVKAS